MVVLTIGMNRGARVRDKIMADRDASPSMITGTDWPSDGSIIGKVRKSLRGNHCIKRQARHLHIVYLSFPEFGSTTHQRIAEQPLCYRSSCLPPPARKHLGGPRGVAHSCQGYGS